MGKSTGFLEYQRINNPAVSPKERIADFNEFHPPLSEEERRKQGARCMNCGIPFCQSAVAFSENAGISGCPLHNLIPEWNDDIYKGQWDSAKRRLTKTNNFPEFTGRVCPALCEASCTCGLDGDPVTVRENELMAIEKAFALGYMQPKPPKIRTDKKVAVIGSGPAGLAVADNLNKRGHNVTVFEREDRPGGLLMYGIPNMKLEKQIIDRRIKLMEAEGITFRMNTDVGVTVTKEELLKEYDTVVLCCGAKEPRALNIGEKEAGNVFFAVDFLTQTTKSLLNADKDLSAFEKDKTRPSAKGKNVIIIGGGDTGNDCVGTCIREGCKSVLQIEMMPEPPKTRSENNPWPEWPKVQKTDYGQEEAIAVFGKDPRVYESTVKSMELDKKGNIKSVTIVKLGPGFKEIEGSEKKLPCNLLLIAAGFIGCESYVTDAFSVKRTPRNVVETSADSYATNVEKVFTAGDMHRGQSLVVWAIAEGRKCAHEVDEFLMEYSYMNY